MVKKIIFLDVDGTLVNDHGVIPDTAKLAIQSARRNGHLVFICTGRSKPELFPEILDIGFDGIIGAAGGFIEVGEEVILHEQVKPKDVQHLVEFFDKHTIDFYLESNGGLFASKNCKTHISRIIDQVIMNDPSMKDEIEKGLQPFHDVLIEGEDLVRNDINKISFLGSNLPIEVIEDEFASIFTVIPSTVPLFGENSGELSIRGIHKAAAIEKLLDHLGLSREDTFGYGDGLNDIEMLDYVRYGIAMGNAKEQVKKVADDITDSHNQNGIYNSFKKYGLI